MDKLFLFSPTKKAGDEVDEVAEGARGMGVDRIGEVGERTSE